ncbi:hypothetical protein ACLOJK_032847 [Asimina triloba]
MINNDDHLPVVCLQIVNHGTPLKVMDKVKKLGNAHLGSSSKKLENPDSEEIGRGSIRIRGVQGQLGGMILHPKPAEVPSLSAELTYICGKQWEDQEHSPLGGRWGEGGRLSIASFCNPAGDAVMARLSSCISTEARRGNTERGHDDQTTFSISSNSSLAMPTDRVIEDCITKMEQGRSGKNSDADRYNFWPPCLWNTAQKVVAEIVGTYFMIFAGCGSVAVNKMYGGSVTFPGICITWGLIVTVLIYTLGHVSGAHFNPVVTITNAVFGRMPYWEVPAYIIAQLLGSILSSGTLRLALDAKAEHFFGTNPAGSDVQSFVFETVITFLLLFVVTSVATDNRAVSNGPNYIVRRQPALICPRHHPSREQY